MTTLTKVCSRPDCKHRGKPQPLTNFYQARVKGKLYARGECKSCSARICKAWYKKAMQTHAGRERLRERKRAYAKKVYYIQKRERLEATKERLGL